MSKYKEDIIRLRKQEKSYREIEDELGCSKGTIAYHCKQEGLEDIGKKQKTINEEKKEEIRKYYKDHTTEETAEHLNVSKGTVQKYGGSKHEKNDYNYDNDPERNTTIKGDISEALVVARYIQRHYGVSTPVNDGLSYDLIVEKNGNLYKTQVKRGRRKNGKLIFKCYSQTRCRGRRPYKESEVDIFAVHDPTTNEIYEVPFDETPNNQMTLRIQKAKNGQTKNINLAEDYKIE